MCLGIKIRCAQSLLIAQQGNSAVKTAHRTVQSILSSNFSTLVSFIRGTLFQVSWGLFRGGFVNFSHASVFFLDKMGSFFPFPFFSEPWTTWPGDRVPELTTPEKTDNSLSRFPFMNNISHCRMLNSNFFGKGFIFNSIQFIYIYIFYKLFQTAGLHSDVY